MVALVRRHKQGVALDVCLHFILHWLRHAVWRFALEDAAVLPDRNRQPLRVRLITLRSMQVEHAQLGGALHEMHERIHLEAM